jgi:YVTN family beta-propeller protein
MRVRPLSSWIVVAAALISWGCIASQGALYRVDVRAGSPPPIRLVPVPGLCVALAFDADAMWGTTTGLGRHYLFRLDPRTYEVTGKMSVGLDGMVLATGYEAVWVSRASEVQRIDPHALRVTATIPVARPTSIVAGYDSMWVASDSGSVLRIDPRTNQVATTISTKGSPYRLAVGRDAVWVAHRSDPLLSRIDPATDRIVASITLPERGSNGLAVTSDAVWVGADNGTVSRINPETNQVVATIQTGIRIGGLVSADDKILVNGRPSNRIDVIDPMRNQVIAKWERPKGLGELYSVVAFGAGYGWQCAVR